VPPAFGILMRMDEREFVQTRQASWERLAKILLRASVAGEWSVPRNDLRDLGGLYRRAAADLAYARSHMVSSSLISHLNQLVAQGYATLYQTDTRSWSGLGTFFAYEFPRTFRRRAGFFLAAVAFTIIGFMAAWILVVRDRTNIDIFVPPDSPFRSSLDVWASGNTSEARPDSQGIMMAGFYVTNNTTVAFSAFAYGIAGGVMTVYSLLQNGAMLGAFAGYVKHTRQLGNFWPAIVPHGVTELSAIFIAGGAGLALGWAVLVPGPYRRRDALVLAARDSVKLVLGVIVLLMFAALVEAFVSHSLLPKPLKITFGVASGVVLYAYLFLAGRDTARG
jgi:uncharacterized membrane protein SpoIIM required for sporulation